MRIYQLRNFNHKKATVVLMAILALTSIAAQQRFSDRAADEKLFTSLYRQIVQNLSKNYYTTSNSSYTYVEYSYDVANQNRLFSAVSASGIFHNMQHLGNLSTRDTYLQEGFLFGKDSTRMTEPLLMFQGTMLTDFRLSSIDDHFVEKTENMKRATENFYKGFTRDTTSHYAVVEEENGYYLIIRQNLVKINGPADGLKIPKSIDEIVFYKVNKENMAVEELIKRETRVSLSGIVDQYNTYEKYKRVGNKYQVIAAVYTKPRYLDEGNKKYERSGKYGLVKCTSARIDSEISVKEAISSKQMKNIDNVQPDLADIQYHNFDVFCINKPLETFEKTTFINDKNEFEKLIHQYDHLLPWKK